MTERASPKLTDLEALRSGLEANREPARAGKRKKKKRAIGSRRGVETVFRNAYRAHLDLIALAATKANIMISINGLILSFLFLSEAFTADANGLLDIPTGVFLVTCFVSMAFAIMSALPDRRSGQWRPEDFKADRANLLVFEDYTALSEEEYVPAMREALMDSDRIYDSMIRQLYFLGAHANKRMRMLRVSYRVFLIGLGLSILTSFVALLMIYTEEPSASSTTPTVGAALSAEAGFGRYVPAAGLQEPSGAARLPDGRYVVVGDEVSGAFSLLRFDEDGRASVMPLILDDARVPDDLEGATVGGDGRVYAVTSHSVDSGDVGDRRRQLLRFRVDGRRAVDVTSLTGLAAPLRASLGLSADDPMEIEGITIDGTGERLLIGLRSPVIDGRAQIAVLENPDPAFGGAPPEITALSLDLGGGGIRGMTYDRRTDGYLILARRESGSREPVTLWYWRGGALDRPMRVTIEGTPSLRRAEGIAPAIVAGADGFLILSDEGRDAGGSPGRYLLLRTEQLSTELGPLLAPTGRLRREGSARFAVRLNAWVEAA